MNFTLTQRSFQMILILLSLTPILSLLDRLSSAHNSAEETAHRLRIN